jgi:hypothetical protein
MAEQGSNDPLRDLLDEKTIADEITRAIEGNDCPNEADLKTYVQGKAGEAEKIEIKSHLIFCNRCQGRVRKLEQEVPKEAALPAPQKPAFKPRIFGSMKPARRLFSIQVLGSAAIALLAAGAVVLILRGMNDFPYGGKVVFAEGDASLRKGISASYEVVTPRSVYVVEIRVDGDGSMSARIPAGPNGAEFSNGDRIPFTPVAEGTLDLYLVPCPVSDGFPDALLADILKFIRTETSVHRENRLKGIETALSLHSAKFIHQIHTVK